MIRKLLCIILGIIAAIMIYSGIAKLNYNIANYYLDVGTMVSYERINGNEGCNYYKIFEYEVDNKKHTFQPTIIYNNCADVDYLIGTQKNIKYNKNDIKEVYLLEEGLALQMFNFIGNSLLCFIIVLISKKDLGHRMFLSLFYFAFMILGINIYLMISSTIINYNIFLIGIFGIIPISFIIVGLYSSIYILIPGNYEKYKKRLLNK